MEEETDKIKGIIEDKNRGVDKHPLFSSAFSRFRYLSLLLLPSSTQRVPLGLLTPRPTSIATTSPFRYPWISPSMPLVKPKYQRCNIYVLEKKGKNVGITHKTGKIFSYHCVYKQYNIYNENYIYTNIGTHGGTFCKTAANMEIANTRKRNI